MVSNTQKKNALPAPKPFLKWAGGKRQLLGEIGSRLPKSFKRYFEPMIGGGALFFSLCPEEATISDLNSDLVLCFKMVKEQPEELIAELSNYPHAEDFYYKLRADDQSSEYSKWSALKKAARLMYLNKTCYNGLYRVNSQGHFNVPFGDYKNPTIVDADSIRACSSALQNTNLLATDFRTATDGASSGDFIYFDPPYYPISKTASFTAYTKRGFDISLHKQLAETCKILDKKGVYFLCSNSYCDFILGLFRNFRVDVINAKRAINSKAEGRSGVKEVLIRNY